MNIDKHLDENDLNKLIEYIDSIHQNLKSLLNYKKQNSLDEKFGYLYKDQNLHEIKAIQKILDLKEFFDLVKNKKSSSKLKVEGIIALYTKINQFENLKLDELNKFKSHKELLKKIQEERNFTKNIFNNLDKSLKIFNLKEKEIKDLLVKEEIDQQELIKNGKQKKLNKLEK